MKRMWMLAVVLGLAAFAMAADKRAGASETTLSRAIEIENGKAVIEVTVAAQGRLFEVEIDGETGKVLEVEDEEGAGR